MGSLVEINDTLEITVEQGFPNDIFDLSKHIVTPVTIKDVRHTLTPTRSQSTNSAPT
jgi:hypothetical protein